MGNAALVAAVVEMVSVALPPVVPVMLTGVVPPKLSVGKSCAPAGLEVMAAVSTTLPVNPPEGETEIEALFPVVAPGCRVTLASLTLKAGCGGATTVIVIDPEAPIKAREPAASGV